MRRKLRRNGFCASKKGIRRGWRDQPTVRVGCYVGNQRITQISTKATDGAEKSRRTRRGSRGLRKGKRRARGCHPRCSVPDRQPVTKAPGNYLVRHRRRTERWLISSSESLRKDVQTFIKMPAGLPVRRRCKLHCLAKWSRLHKRAGELGFPPSRSFNTTLFRWIDEEFPKEVMPVRVSQLLRVSNPFAFIDPPISHWSQPVETMAFPILGTPNLIRQDRGGRGNVRPEQNNRACRMCGYVGPGPHAWNSCKTKKSPNERRSDRSAKVRRCGCKTGAKCPH